MTSTNWKDSLTTALRATALKHGDGGSPDGSADMSLIPLLNAAAKLFDARRDAFAEGKGDTCRDLSAKLQKYGNFASDKQRQFALKLVEWSKPRAPATGTVTADGLMVPKLFAVMQKHSTFHAGALFKLTRRNQDTLCWVIWQNLCVGKLEEGRATLFTKRLGADVAAVTALLVEFEANPLVAAMKYGKLAGRCCSCGRDLTDPVSIEQGIGPICAQRFA